MLRCSMPSSNAPSATVSRLWALRARLDEVKGVYRRMGRMWNNDDGKDLEALGGGFNVTLEVLKDKEKRSKIAEVIRKCGDCMDEVVNIIKKNVK